MRLRHMSRRTAKPRICTNTVDFIRFHVKRHPRELGLRYGHGLAQFTVVYHSGALLGDEVQRSRQVSLHEAISRSQRYPVTPVNVLRVLRERVELRLDPRYRQML